MNKRFIFMLVFLLPLTVFGVSAAANSVPKSFAGEDTTPISITDLVPEECRGIGISRIENVATGQARGSGANTLFLGTAGNDTINGKNGSDCLVGGDGNDTLLGGQGNDVLLGNNGDDSLDGGQGTDTCYGGGGSNNFNRCESTP